MAEGFDAAGHANMMANLLAIGGGAAGGGGGGEAAPILARLVVSPEIGGERLLGILQSSQQGFLDGKPKNIFTQIDANGGFLGKIVGELSDINKAALAKIGGSPHSGGGPEISGPLITFEGGASLGDISSGPSIGRDFTAMPPSAQELS